MTEPNTQNPDTQRQITRLLRSKGISPTSQRVKIASALFARPQHLTAEQLMDLANENGRPVSKATVYNTLGLFTRKGLIRELIVDSSRSFYDSSNHTHHHLYNPDTQELHDISEQELDIPMPTSLPEGTEVDRIEVVIHLKSSKNSA
ncbi:MAG: Fur family transcriptional regulator [Candidatus Sedimenticola sp. 6PFRAG7]